MKELIVLSLTGVVSMLADMFNMKSIVKYLAVIGLTATIGFSIFDWGIGQRIFGMMQIDNYALAFTTVICSVALIWCFMSEDYFDKLPVATDRYALIFFVLVGAMVMVSYTNLVMLFIGIEILSVSLYVLAGSQKTDLNSTEAAFKYFLMGAFASGFLLFGIALIYGATGFFDLLQIRAAVGQIADVKSTLIVLGIIMLLIGLGFKISAAPFHFWAPDVYQGSPTMITAFMATIVKTAAFAALYRLLVTSFPLISGVWSDIVVAMIVLTLLIGNVTAVMQHDAKRMLAYSSISNAGYMLIAVLCSNTESDNTILYYAAAYSLATIVSFLILYIVSKNTGSTDISAFNSLGKKYPLFGIAMSLSLLSLAGIPPLAGFMGKYYVFANAISEGYSGLIIFAVAMSLIGVYYYFKIIIAMFFAEPHGEDNCKVSLQQNVILALCCIGLLLLGIMPQWIYGVL